MFSASIPMRVDAEAAPRVGAARAAVAGSVERPVIIAIGALLGESTTHGHLIGLTLIWSAVALTAATRPASAIPGERMPSTQR